MASRNPLEKRILRRCPDIVDERGRDLEVVLDPEDGGTVSLRWSGDKGGPFAKVSLRDLALGGASAAPQGRAEEPARQRRGQAGEVDLTRWISYEALMSLLHVAPVETMKERLAMVGIVRVLRSARMYREWLGSRTSASWEEWKRKYSDEALMASIPQAEWPEGAPQDGDEKNDE